MHPWEAVSVLHPCNDRIYKLTPVRQDLCTHPCNDRICARSPLAVFGTCRSSVLPSGCGAQQVAVATLWLFWSQSTQASSALVSLSEMPAPESNSTDFSLRVRGRVLSTSREYYPVSGVTQGVAWS